MGAFRSKLDGTGGVPEPSPTKHKSAGNIFRKLKRNLDFKSLQLEQCALSLRDNTTYTNLILNIKQELAVCILLN